MSQKFDWEGKPIPYEISYPGHEAVAAPIKLAEEQRLRAENAQLRAELEAIYSTEPVAEVQEVREWFRTVCVIKMPAPGTKLIPLPVRKS